MYAKVNQSSNVQFRNYNHAFETIVFLNFIATLQSSGFRTLLEYSSDFRFDLIINDYLVGGCLLGFVHKFNYPPLLSVTAFSHPPYTVALIGGHHYYSYVPHYNLFYQDDMNFFQRFYNFAVHLAEL